MIRISKIPENINRYAIECARKICNEPVENGKGIDFNLDKIFSESDLFKGEKDHLFYDFGDNPKDIFVHNHPRNVPLSFNDINTAVEKGIKKIFASTKDSFTSMDFTTINESISKNDIGLWIIDADKKSLNVVKESNSKINGSNFDLGITLFNILKFREYLNGKLQEFAKFSGAIFENVKWSDFK